MAIRIVGATSAAAAPDCCPDGVQATVSAATGAARQFLKTHPDANRVVTAAPNKQRLQASGSLRDYISSHPQECSDLRGLLAPIGDT